MNRNEGILRQAIDQRLCLSALYRGHRREFCPHVLGLKDGQLNVLVYQHGGTSNSGLGPPGSGDRWRCFEVAGLTQLVATDGAWASASNYDPRCSCVDRIIAEVDA